jgi:voltage-gated potassium channel
LKANIEDFKDHYVICGYGQMGQIVAERLRRSRVPVMVIDHSDGCLTQCREQSIPCLRGDAMEEENLKAAGVERAKGLISVVNRDADNVFIVLTARALNPDLSIYARSGSKGVESKLIRAGANRVVSPYATAARRIIQNVLRPTVTDFLELALSGEGIELEMEELIIPETASFAGKALKDSGIRGGFNLIIVAIKRLDGTRIYNPSPLEPLMVGDTLIAVGPQADMDRFFQHLYGTSRDTENDAAREEVSGGA